MIERIRPLANDFYEGIKLFYGKQYSIGNYSGEIVHLLKPCILKNGKVYVSFILFNRTTNTYIHLRKLWFSEGEQIASEILYEFCGVLKEAICLASNSIQDALVHSSFKDDLRVLRHYKDMWKFQLLNDDSRLINFTFGRGSHSKGKINTSGIKNRNVIISLIEDEGKIYFDSFQYDKTNGKYIELETKEFDDKKSLDIYLKRINML